MSEDISVLGIAVETRGVKEGSDALDRLTAAGGRAEKSTNTLGTESRKTSTEIVALAKAAATAAGAFGVWTSIKGIASSMIDAQQAAQKLRNSLSYAADGAAGASKEIQYLREVTTRLGMDFATSSAAYAKFAAATKDSGVSLSQTKTVFEGIAAASAKLGLSADETQGALLALSQMASKGVVSAEELRGQLGERLPGAFNIAAKSMGVTTAELGKMMERGEVMASDFLPRFGQALKDNFQAPLNSLTQEINRFSSAWTIWKTELSDGANGSGFKWLTNGLNESSAAMHALGAEAGITQKLLMAVGGFQAGAVGSGKYDTTALQAQAFEKLAKAREKLADLEGKQSTSRLTSVETQQMEHYTASIAAAKDELLRLAVVKGKQTGVTMPDIAGDYLAQEKKKADALKAYLSDTDNAPKAAKVAAAVEKENAAFKIAVAAYSETDQQYQTALKAHNERVAELQKQPKGASTTKNDSAQEYAARLSEEKDFTKTQIDLIKARVEQRVISEEDGIKQVLESQTAGFSAQQATLNAQLAATSDKGDKLRIGSQLQAIANDAQTAQMAYTTAMSKMAQARTQYMQSQAEGYDNAATKVDQENAALRDQIDILGMTDQQLGEYETAKVRVAAAAEYLAASNLREAAASLQASDATNDAIPYYLQLADAREAAGRALDQKSLLESEKGMKKAAIEADKEWKKTADKISDNITDALMRGFESGKGFAETFRDTVKNMFKTLILRPVIQATVMGGLSALGMGSATAADGLSGLGSLYNLASTGSSLFQAGSMISGGYGALPGTTALANASGMLGGDSLGSLISMNAHWTGAAATELGASIGTAAGTALAGSAAGTVFATTATGAAVSTTTAAGVAAASGTGAAGAGAAGTGMLAAVPVAGWIALAAIAAYSIFSKDGGGPKTNAEAATTINANGSLTELSRQPGQDVTGNMDYRDSTAQLISNVSAMSIATYAKQLGGSAAGVSTGLYYNTDPEGEAKDNVSGRVTNAAGQVTYVHASDVDRGQGQAELAIEVQRVVLAGIGASDVKQVFKDLVSGIDIAAADAAALKQAFTDLQDIVSLRSAFDNINLGAENLSMSIIKSAGGISALGTSLESYYGSYFSQAEKTANTTEALTKSFAGLGIAVPASKEAFRAVVEGLDLTTTSGASTFAALMALAPSFATVTDAAAASAKALADARTSLMSKFGATTTVEQATQTINASGLINVTGMDAETMKAAMRTLISAASQGTLESISALTPSFDILIQSLDNIASATKALNDESATLNIELLRAQGKEEQALAAERAIAIVGMTAQQTAIYDSNAAIRKQISSISALATAASEAASRMSSAAATFKSTFATDSTKAADLRSSLSAIGVGMPASQEAFIASVNTFAATAYAKDHVISASLKSVSDAYAANLAAGVTNIDRMLADGIASALAGTGLTLPATIAELDALIASISIDGNGPTAKKLADLQNLSPAVAEYFAALKSQSDAAVTANEQALAALQDAIKTATESKRSISYFGVDSAVVAQREAARLTTAFNAAFVVDAPATLAAAQRMAAALDPSVTANRTLIASLAELAAALNTAEEASAATAKAIADQRANLESQLLTAQGNTVAIRAKELAALDASNRALQEQIWALEDQKTALETIKTNANDAYAALERAVAAQRKVAQASIDAAQEQVASLKSIFDNLKTGVATLYGEVDSTSAMGAADGQAFIANALSNALSSGYMPDPEDLADAVAAAMSGTSDAIYASQIDADRAKLVLAGQMDSLKKVSGSQLSVAELALNAAREQLESLDAVLESQKSLLDAAMGIDTSVLSVATAIANLGASIAALAGATRVTPTVGAPSTPVGTPLTPTVPTVPTGGTPAAPVTPSTPSAPPASASLRDTLLAMAIAGNGVILSGGVPVAQTAQILAGGSALFDIAHKLGMPGYASGANVIPNDQFAQIHKGEAIIPAAFNPWLGGRASNNDAADLLAELKALREEVNLLRYEARATASNTSKTAKTLDKWDGDGQPAERVAA